jgi:hypothetical protein
MGITSGVCRPPVNGVYEGGGIDCNADTIYKFASYAAIKVKVNRKIIWSRD